MPNVWGILMETGYPQAVVTLVSLADGTTSLYFSHGGGVIGGGQHETVARASKSFVIAAEGYYPKMTLTKSFPFPPVGRVKFYVLTYSGIYPMYINENDLGNLIEFRDEFEFSPRPEILAEAAALSRRRFCTGYPKPSPVPCLVFRGSACLQTKPKLLSARLGGELLYST